MSTPCRDAASAKSAAWACIALPQLALDGVLRHHPQRHAPLALVGGSARQRVLLAVNQAALAAGLRAGQRLVQALAIAPDCTLVAHVPEESLRWQRLLAAWACRYSSQVSIQWPNALVLEVASSLKLMKGWQALQAHWRSQLQALQFTHRIALAPNPCAAWVFAQLRDGLAFWQQPTMLAALAQIPVRRAALPDDAGQSLHAMGLHTLGQVFAMPRAGLRRRFGQPLLDHLDRLRGLVPQPLICHEPPAAFAQRIELTFHVDSHQPLLFVLRRMVADLAAFLHSRCEGVQRFVVQLEHADRPATRITIGLLSPERHADALFEIARARLERTTLPAAVTALHLQARDLPPLAPASLDLFAQRPGSASSWEQLRERLRARLGEDSLYTLQETTDPRPEYAWQRSQVETPDSMASTLPAGARPTWLLPEPIALEQPPRRILQGPERLETGWWDGGDARRDYYVLETARGQRAWAFVPAGQQGPWMLHGWFA
ncbi:hypothetical protein AAV94_01240 [Lampropedia cohaerens]|uniref:UmuC domain-containing protein n=1 Tax=Lampropedia cohaerens TaxID=1610491 RepID=A0A0U1Q2T4_9BURK|nr:DNA polymerase Y family protein [Lampropedia cohaerens]KKW69061.1 hypothetical protein AAV94_01240 [Lampropedia cohaerens]